MADRTVTTSDAQIGTGTTPGTILEQGRPLSQSLLWQLQRDFFERQGIAAWSQVNVPHYITSNPFIAQAYARVVCAFLRDCRAADGAGGFAPLDPSEPVYVIELGAGPGRFAYHFLKSLMGSLAGAGLEDARIRYVLTDFHDRLRDYWRSHAWLQPLVAAGQLDFARFDIMRDEALALDQAGTVLAPGTVKNPLVVIANYCFDSVPQDVFHIEKGQAFAGTVTLSSPQAEPDLADPQLLNRLEISCDYQPVKGPCYPDAEWNDILDGYRQKLSNTNVLFPIAVLQGLRSLSRIAGGRMLLISGDKGISRPEDLLGRREPEIATHDGCFSLMVNYHAVGQYVLNAGGQFLHTPHRQAHLDVCAFLWGAHPRNYAETRLAYAQAIERNGPDDFFVLKQALEQRYEQLTPDQVLAHLRTSGWDSAVLLGCMPALLAKAEGLPETARQELYWAAQQVWVTYFPIGERLDVAFHIGMLLHALHYYLEAIEFFRRSIELYGLTPSTAYDLGVCHYELQQLSEAGAWADRALELDPEYEPAKTLRIRIESQLSRAATTADAPA